MFSGNKRFSELKALIEGVTHRSLTLQLRELEEDGIITRTVFPVIPPHVEYALSPLGRTMEPIINAMYDWGVAYSKLDIKETQNSVSN
ncbi:winged helix-turn-helix transcriptional regulator [Veillonella seminalis]|uniref:winged helix-turn-helix transcriptional regulator n=1 Tax=Veillonella seminalis TaxID=1502943 RepID=UPI001F0B7A0E|nr:winged helix-turn-helix transcriptional regulator [Veillonella seminalis]